MASSSNGLYNDNEKYRNQFDDYLINSSLNFKDDCDTKYDEMNNFEYMAIPKKNETNELSMEKLCEFLEKFRFYKDENYIIKVIKLMVKCDNFNSNYILSHFIDCGYEFEKILKSICLYDTNIITYDLFSDFLKTITCPIYTASNGKEEILFVLEKSNGILYKKDFEVTFKFINGKVNLLFSVHMMECNDKVNVVSKTVNLNDDLEEFFKFINKEENFNYYEKIVCSFDSSCDICKNQFYEINIELGDIDGFLKDEKIKCFY